MVGSTQAIAVTEFDDAEGFDIDNDDSYVEPNIKQVGVGQHIPFSGMGGGDSPRSFPNPYSNTRHSKERALALLDPIYRPVWNPTGKRKY